MQPSDLSKALQQLRPNLRGLRWLAVIAFLWLIALWLAMGQPSLDAKFSVSNGRGVVASPLVDDGKPVVVERISAKGLESIALQPSDLMEEPDQLPSYEAWSAFYQRQGLIAGLLQSSSVVLHTADGRDIAVPVTDTRHIGSLPFVYWFQLLVGAIGLLTGAWVLHLRPAEASSKYLFLTGLGLALSSCAAAVYSTRELALSVNTFSFLSKANHVGVVAFGIGLINLFLHYPKEMGPRWLPKLVISVFSLWLLADLNWLVPSPQWGTPIMTVTMLLLAIGLGIAQWRRVRHDLPLRISFRWILLSFVFGSGLFVALVVVVSLLGWNAVISQGYAFGFFLVVYFGLALAVARYRVFDLDKWSLRVLMWLFGLLGILSLDALLIYLRLSETLSLIGSVLVCAALYFPLRQWLWQKLNHRDQPNLEMLSAKAMEVALASPEQRQDRWRQALADVFHPLRIEPASSASPMESVQLIDDGLGLRVNCGPNLPSFTVWNKDAGNKLFSPSDVKTADQLLRLVQMSVDARDAHEQGAREERGRIAQDLHDDLGAKLLTIAQTSSDPYTSQLAREATQDMRLTVKSLSQLSQSPAALMADWRVEAVNRLQAAGLSVEWRSDEPPPDLRINSRIQVQVTRILREAISNLIRHARATKARVELCLSETDLTLRVHDDGQGFHTPDPSAATEGLRKGHGLLNIERRTHLLGGQHRFAQSPLGGAMLEVRIPL
jgi:signal transduction histidine kinase